MVVFYHKSTYFNEISSMASSEHMEIIQNVIKEKSPSQEHPCSSSTPAISFIFDWVLDAFKLIGPQPNLKYNSLRTCAEHAKHHQGQ